MKRGLCVTAICAALFAAVASAAEVPRRSPEFSIALNSGKQVLLSSYRGKVVALMFVLTYCPHCQQAIQTVSRLQTEYGPRGFQALASAIEDMASLAVPDFVRRFQPPFPVGFNNRDQVLEYLQHPPMYKLLMPQLVFVDREGVIRAQYAGDDAFFGADEEKNLRAKIESLLKESPSNGHAKRTSRPVKQQK
jgi:thiol-disulfide isomerase/thioredoxin